MLKQRNSGNITEQKRDLVRGEQFLLPLIRVTMLVGCKISVWGAPFPTYPSLPGTPPLWQKGCRAFNMKLEANNILLVSDWPAKSKLCLSQNKTHGYKKEQLKPNREKLFSETQMQNLANTCQPVFRPSCCQGLSYWPKATHFVLSVSTLQQACQGPQDQQWAAMTMCLGEF